MSKSLINKVACKAMLTDWLVAAGGWDNGTAGVSLVLFTNDYVPAGDDTAASFTACTIAGAAAKTAIKPAAVTTFPDGSIGIHAQPATDFLPTVEPDPAVTVYGWFIKGTGSGTLLAAKRFDDPVQLHNGETVLFDAIVVSPNLISEPDPVLP